MKVLCPSVHAATNSRNVPLSKLGWRSSLRREQLKPEVRNHPDEMRYCRGQENHYAKSCKKQLTKQHQSSMLNIATKTETKLGRHKKMPLKTDLIFLVRLDPSVLLALWSHPQPTFKATYPSKDRLNFRCFCLQAQQKNSTQYSESSRPNCSALFLHVGA